MTLRDEYTKLRDIARKRVVTLERAGRLEESSLVRYERGIPKITEIEQKYRNDERTESEVRALADKEIGAELQILKYNLYSKAKGSLKGIKEVERNTKRAIKEEKRRLKERIKAKNKEAKKGGQKVDRVTNNFVDEVFKRANELMDFLRAIHLDSFVYYEKGSGFETYDKLSDMIAEKLRKGGDVSNRDIIRDIIGNELIKFEAGKKIFDKLENEGMAQEDMKELRELGTELNNQIGSEKYNRRGRKKR